jgi:tRNA pseudouridine38-40 synthase
MDKINEAGALIIGAHDFATFGQPTDGTVSTVREIFEAQWESSGPEGMITFSITGSGFLRYMVRSLVGTLIQVGAGKMTKDQFAVALKARDRSRAGPTAAPQGLFLMKVFYDEDLFCDVDPRVAETPIFPIRDSI